MTKPGRGYGPARAAALALALVAVVQRSRSGREPSSPADPSAPAGPRGSSRLDAPAQTTDPDPEVVEALASPELEKAGPRRTSPPAEGKLMKRVQAAGNRFRPLGVALDVQQRFGELHGTNLAAAVTFQAFLALFPLLLITISVVGFFSVGSDQDLTAQAVSSLGLSGDAASSLQDAISTAEESRRGASIVGFLFLAYSALGLTAALQYGFNQVWQVESRGVKDKGMGVVWFLGFVLVALSSGVVTAGLRFLPAVLAPLGLVVSLLINFLLFLWTAKVLPNRDVGWRPLVPGAIFGAVAFEVLKLVAAYYVPRTVASSSELYGSIGVVLAVLGFLFLLGRVLIYAAVLDVVLFEGHRGTRKVVIEVPNTPGIQDPVANRSGQADPKDKAEVKKERKAKG